MKSFSQLILLFMLTLLAACGNDDGNPVLPQISASSLSQVEGDANNSMTFAVKLSAASKKVITVDFSTKDLGAKAGEDYVAQSGTLSFAAGETEKSLVIEILADTLREYDDRFEITLFNPKNAQLTAPITGTIINDDSFLADDDLGYTTPDNYPGYTLVWQDEFSGSGIDPANWKHELGASGWGNNELENYTARPDNSFVSNGRLVIEAKKENYNGSEYTSARMITQGLREFKYGRIDIRAKLPTGQGIWPALWMLGNNIGTVGWPKCGEIDIMEIVGHEPATLHGTVHWDNGGSYANYGKSTKLSSGTFADEYHVFSIVWDSQYIKWLLDDVQFNVIDITPAGLSEFQNEFFLIFNVAVGGNWPGNPNSSTVFPQQMRVDYVRVFQQ
jgi:beta-glucanase (GH16 family)